jgi:hypothetical protein
MAGNTTTANVLRTLHLFVQRKGRVRVLDVVEQLGVSPATAYRYLGELEDAGLASRFASSEYVLGPGIATLERTAREHDPYLAAAQPVLTGLARGTGASIALGRSCGGEVILLAGVVGTLGPADLHDVRGRSGSFLIGRSRRPVLLGQAETAAGAQGSGANSIALPSWDTVVSADLHMLRCVALIRQRKRIVGTLCALFRVDVAPSDLDVVADQLWRACLRIEGRLKTSAAKVTDA